MTPPSPARPSHSTEAGLSGWFSPSLATVTGDDGFHRRPRARPADPLPERFGRYPVMKLLGRGGFANVYLARDDKLGRPVAIKVPHPELFRSPGQVELFQAEARIAAGLKHPAIVQVYDVGRSSATGGGFVVFEYVEGREPVGGVPGRPVSPATGRGADGPRSPRPRTTPTGRAGPPRPQALEHPDRLRKAGRTSPTSAWPSARTCSSSGPARSPARPPTWPPSRSGARPIGSTAGPMSGRWA